MDEPIASKTPEASGMGRARGGHARAAKLTPEQRSDIARRAASKRWDDSIPEATFGSADHPLRIGDREIPCYVLADGRRVLVQRGMMTALDMSQGTAGRGGGDRLAKFISTKTIRPFISEHLEAMINNPIRFKIPGSGGASAYGYEATVLADMCDAVLEARKKKKTDRDAYFNYQIDHIADQCEILVRAFARVGIIALVDEATGYQEVRDRDALEAILDKFLRKELAAWARRFPDEFYQQIFRLKGWTWRGMSINRPSVVGKYTNDLVYERLAPNILQELEARNPRDERGNRKHKHHQWLTEDVGHPALAQHLYAIIGFMRISDSWEAFHRIVDRAFPKKNTQMLLPGADV